jgi:uncharacterized protein YodC (DUF2158 family)
VVWDLAYHPFQPILLSCGQQAIIWDCKEIEKSGEPGMTVCRTSSDGSAPTCGAWLNTKMNMFVVGHQDATLAFYDTVKNSVTATVQIPGYF